MALKKEEPKKTTPAAAEEKAPGEKAAPAPGAP